MAPVRVRLFASHREAAGRSAIVLDLPPEATVAHLRKELARAVPSLARLGGFTLVAVNGEFAPDGRKVTPRDEVAVFPPVAGG